MSFETDALVLKSGDAGESDRIVTLLTADYGVIRAFANKAKKSNSQMQAATQTFCYGRFSVYTGRDSYTINRAEAKEVFFELRQDIERLALGQYFCSLAVELIPEGEPAPDSLRVILNSLSFLQKEKRSKQFLKAVTELKLISLAGNVYFDTDSGRFFCEKHKKGNFVITPGVLTAMRHVTLNPVDRIYSFALTPADEELFGRVTENFLLRRTGKSFKALEFYKTVSLG